MTLKQLEMFVSLVETKSFSKTAEAIFVSQPSVSVALSSLEKEFSVKLIDRGTRDIAPTPAGAEFYRYARTILDSGEKVRRAMTVFTPKGTRVELSGTVSIVASSVPCDYILPSLVAEFRTLHPSVVFEISQAKSLDIPKIVTSSKGLIGISGYKCSDDECSCHSFMEDELVIISSEPPSGDSEISIDDLIRDHFFVGRISGSGTAKVFEDFLGERAKNVRYSAAFYSTDSVIAAVSKGVGIAAVSKIALSQSRHVFELPVAAPLPVRSLYAMTKHHAKLPCVAREFFRYILNKNNPFF